MMFHIKKVCGHSEDWERISSQGLLYGESGTWVRLWNLDVISILVIENRILAIRIWSLMIYTDNQFRASMIDSCREGLKYRLKNLKARLRVHPVVKREWFIHKSLFTLSPFLICTVESSIKIGTMSMWFISIPLASGQGLAHIKHSANACWINK